jgi:phosphoglycerate dehydrogenase-like enzyme
MATLTLAFKPDPARKPLLAEAADGAEILFLPELRPDERASALRRTTVFLAWHLKDLRPRETELLRGTRLVQFMTAGVDFIPLSELPVGIPVASNGGAYAAPMAEHAFAMVLAAAKRLLAEHRAMASGQFNQFARNRMLAGGVCGILGFGGIGAAVARLARGIGMRVHAVNRRGSSDEPVNWIATPERLDELLSAADVLVVSTPLTRATHGLIDAQALARMKKDAILVNLARGEIIDERALYDHLRAHPGFTACIDAWWVEPVRHGTFRMDLPFLDLPNVIASPHNSAQAGDPEAGLRHALANCCRALRGETPLHLIGPDERLS